MTPSPSRIAALYRKTSRFDLGDYLREVKENAMSSLLQQVEREVQTKLAKSFESSFPDWEMVEVEIEERVDRQGGATYSSELLISATGKPKPSHPEYDWIYADDDLSRELLQWVDDITASSGTGEARDNGEDGSNLRYYLYFGGFVW